MMSSGIADGSWDLTILVADLNLEKTLRVKGDLHIGGLMLKLVEDLGKTFLSWFAHIHVCNYHTAVIFTFLLVEGKDSVHVSKHCWNLANWFF